MVRSSTLLQTRNKNYELEAPNKGKPTSETSNPLTIVKPIDPMPKIPKGSFKKSFHNPNARFYSKYFVVEYLAQTLCAISALEVLQSFPSQRDALLATIFSMDSMSLLENFNISDVKIWFPYHVYFSIDFFHGVKTMG